LTASNHVHGRDARFKACSPSAVGSVFILYPLSPLGITPGDLSDRGDDPLPAIRQLWLGIKV
jgi:hypothetical protein